MSVADLGRRDYSARTFMPLAAWLRATGGDETVISVCEAAGIDATTLDAIRLRDARGLGYLAQLLHHPGRQRRGYFCVYLPDPRRPISWEG